MDLIGLFESKLSSIQEYDKNYKVDGDVVTTTVTINNQSYLMEFFKEENNGINFKIRLKPINKDASYSAFFIVNMNSNNLSEEVLKDFHFQSLGFQPDNIVLVIETNKDNDVTKVTETLLTSDIGRQIQEVTGEYYGPFNYEFNELEIDKIVPVRRSRVFVVGDKYEFSCRIYDIPTDKTFDGYEDDLDYLGLSNNDYREDLNTFPAISYDLSTSELLEQYKNYTKSYTSFPITDTPKITL